MEFEDKASPMTVIRKRSTSISLSQAFRRVNPRDQCSRQTARLCLVLVLCLSAIHNGAAQTPSQTDLSRLDVEDLMNIKVTSVSKREQSMSRTAAAVFVISQEDIRRSGATNIPDLLRMAPGVDVAQIDANAWAISIRGFNSRYSNKVLVLIDGRTVYTPSFSGAFWEHLDMPLENIDRIEVIRGPGASVWGANAVNGVISIFTKSSKDTKGGLITAGAGTQTKALGMVQYGGSAGPGSYRVYGKSFDVGNSARPDGAQANDHWMRANGGFQTDWDLSSRDSLMVQGSLFLNEAQETQRGSLIATPYDRIFNQGMDEAGGDVLARWNHTLAGGSQTSVQTYYDTYRRTEMGVPEKLRTFDLDFQHHVAVGNRHDIVWGFGYRVSDSGLSPGYFVAFSPPSQTTTLYGGFVQDEIRLSESLWLTAGVKLEHNAYNGLQTEPSLRLAWNAPGSRHTIWAAASKALRQPSIADTSVVTDLESMPIGPGAVEVLRLLGNPSIKEEELRDYELGYRTELTRTLSLDATSFLSFYHHLQTLEAQPMVIMPGSPMVFEIPMLFDTKAHAVTYGGELSLRWNLNSRWRISPGYSYLHATIRQDPSSQGQSEYTISNGFPQNMFQIRSSLNLWRGTQFDQSLYYTARLPGAAIPGHARLDLRLARHIGESTEISLVGQNLLRPRTTEFGDAQSIIGTQAVRSIYAQIAWKF
jgi:iron complex outermembrane recepter protein